MPTGGTNAGTEAVERQDRHNSDLLQSVDMGKVQTCFSGLAATKPGAFSRKTYNEVKKAIEGLQAFESHLQVDPSFMSRDTLFSFQKQYDQAIKAVIEYANESAKAHNHDRETAARTLMAQLQKDRLNLDDVQFGWEKSENELGKENRRTVMHPGTGTSIVKGGSSSRIKIPGEGFFTEEKYVEDPVQYGRKLKESLLEQYGRNLTLEMRELFRNETESAEVGSYTQNVDLFTRIASENGGSVIGMRDMKDPVQKHNELIRLMGMAGVPANEATLLLQNKTFEDMAMEYTIKMAENIDSFSNFQTFGLREGFNQSDRNVAMSLVADRLKVGGLLAKSERAKLQMPGNGGTPEYKYGVIMEKADGIDMKDIYEGDRISSVSEIVYDEECIKQANDMVFLDYICGNSDRNMHNIFYQVELQDGVAHMTGIKGIDNDMSFPVKMNTPTYPKIDACKYISSDLRKRILDLTEAEWKADLKGILEPSAIEAGWDRVKHLKDRINAPDGLISVPDKGYSALVLTGNPPKQDISMLVPSHNLLRAGNENSLLHVAEFIHNVSGMPKKKGSRERTEDDPVAAPEVEEAEAEAVVVEAEAEVTEEATAEAQEAKKEDEVAKEEEPEEKEEETVAKVEEPAEKEEEAAKEEEPEEKEEEAAVEKVEPEATATQEQKKSVEEEETDVKFVPYEEETDVKFVPYEEETDVAFVPYEEETDVEQVMYKPEKKAKAATKAAEPEVKTAEAKEEETAAPRMRTSLNKELDKDHKSKHKKDHEKAAKKKAKTLQAAGMEDLSGSEMAQESGGTRIATSLNVEMEKEKKHKSHSHHSSHDKQEHQKHHHHHHKGKSDDLTKPVAHSESSKKKDELGNNGI